MKYLRCIGLAALALAASCATLPPPGAEAPTGDARIPSAAIELGDYRNANAGAVLSQFERTIASRYGEGMSLSTVAADLRRNDFNCAAVTPGERGDPPNQVCRRTVTADACTYTWQVHLFDAGNNARLSRTRALYDRRCGADGLLGGPG